MRVPFSRKMGFLFEPHRYKVAHGGRGSGKSWAFCQALVIQAAEKPLRILCTREVQKSIKDSVHRLISDQIQALGLGHLFEVLEHEIRGLNGSLFLFAGLAQHTVESIKSYEGLDRVWCEEAQVISRRSWDILTPTIRKPGSEIWISFNPDLDTDETWLRFVEQKPTDCNTVEVNWYDNPWFPEVLEQERRDCLVRDPDGYKNIWGGKTKAAVDGAIYAAEIAAMQTENRITNLPYDPSLKVHVVWDLGWNDSMFLGLVQKDMSALRIIETIQDDHKTLDWFSAELRKKNLNWGKLYLPHDGRHGNIQTGKSAQQTLQAMGWDVDITPNIAVKAGIDQTRMAFRRLYMDRTKCAPLIECCKRYRRSINAATREPGEPVHDEYSHGADMLRYLAINADRMTNETYEAAISYPSIGIV